ncbi:MAG: ATP-binding cassette domain-containing protein [Pirellulales bacterium]|nr:ATP-binding cassette domain-containing protein [Pirellulales bacterium]
MSTPLPSANPADLRLQHLSQVLWIFDHWSLETGHTVDRARLRRTLEENAAQQPETLPDDWSKWLLTAEHTLDQRCRVIDCTHQQLLELCQAGLQAIMLLPDQTWLGLTSLDHHGVTLFEAAASEVRTLEPEKLEQYLESKNVPPVARVFAIETLDHAGWAEHHEHSAPHRQFWELLKPEWYDIWMVLIFAVVIGLLSLATPLAVESLVSTVAFGRFFQPVIILAIMLFIILAFQAALRTLQTFVVEIIQRRLFARIVADLAYRLPRVRSEALDRQSGRELVNRYFEIVTVQKVTAQLLLDGISLVLNTFIGMAVLAFYHPWLLGFDIILVTMLVIVLFVMGRGAIQSSIAESRTKYNMASWLEDLSDSPIALRYNGAARFAMERVDQISSEYLIARQRHFRILIRQIMFALGMQALATTVLLGLGGWLVISQQMTLGQLVAANLIVATIVDSFAKLGKHLESFYDVMASMDKLNHLFELPIEPQGSQMLAKLPDNPDLRMQQVSYSFPHRPPVLKNLDLTISAGERIVLVGPSGGGKSVMLDLLYGLRTPQSGHVAIGGLDYRGLPTDLLRSVVVLVRDIEVFERTIAENIHLGRADISASELQRALEQVGLLDDVLDLPQGLDTVVATNGQPLTGNQLRKLMLARALVQQPSVLLVDGTLDTLPDDEAEAILLRLCASERGRTLVLVTGRASLARLCQRQLQFPLT